MHGFVNDAEVYMILERKNCENQNAYPDLKIKQNNTRYFSNVSPLLCNKFITI